MNWCNKKKYIDEIVASNEMTQEEFDNQTQEISWYGSNLCKL